MNPCNPCDQGKCGSCVAQALEAKGMIRSAAFHCGCAEKGHKNKEVTTDRPGVKVMLSRSRKEETPKNSEVAEEE